jgi:DNA primase
MDHIAQIKARLPIESVVGSYIRLERAGSNFRAICPFHKEKSPSFNVSPARDAFYCFGCTKGGDIFTFVQEIEGMTFPEALKILAIKAGVQLPERINIQDSHKKDEKDRLIELMEATTNIFQAQYAIRDDVKEYLIGRGLTEETINTFRIGFAPLEWRSLYDALKLRGFTDIEMEKARVVKKVEGKGYYDTFRGRIMFPIMDSSGRVVAFTGRIFGDQKNPDGSSIAKYLNSPEGELYDKSSILFGYDRAKIAIRKADQAVIVEGQMDCIMSHQAGVDNTIAISGTALTTPQIGLIKRLTNKMVLALDSDNAGVAATLRSARLALGEDMNVKVCIIPDGKDPADYIINHGDNWISVINSGEPVITYLLKLYSKQGIHGEILIEKIKNEVFPLIEALPSKIAQSQFVSEVARVLSVRDIDVWDDIKKYQKSIVKEDQQATHSEGQLYINAYDKVVVSSRIMAEKELKGLLLWKESHTDVLLDIEAIQKEYDRLHEEYSFPKYESDELEDTKLLMITESKFDQKIKLQEVAEELIDRIEKDMLVERCNILTDNIRKSEGSGEDTSSDMRELSSLKQKQRRLEDRMKTRIIFN